MRLRTKLDLLGTIGASTGILALVLEPYVLGSARYSTICVIGLGVLCFMAQVISSTDYMCDREWVEGIGSLFIMLIMNIGFPLMAWQINEINAYEFFAFVISGALTWSIALYVGDVHDWGTA